MRVAVKGLSRRRFCLILVVVMELDKTANDDPAAGETVADQTDEFQEEEYRTFDGVTME